MKFKTQNLPPKPGIYMFKNAGNEVLYVGKSINIRTRIRSYLRTKDAESTPKLEKLLSEAAGVDFILTASDFEALILEAHLIKAFQPRYNVRLKDDKRFLYVKITIRDKFPRVSTSRKESETNAIYFGPYPSARTVKDVLRMIRRIFPYCAQKSTAKKRCFYAHINLCDPCPAEIGKLPSELQIAKTKEYQNNIRNIIELLSGKRKRVQLRLKKQMEMFAERQNYEEAGRIKKQLDMLEYVVARKKNSIAKYLTDLEEMEQGISGAIRLRETLRPYLKNFSTPVRIEGYDISNIQGKQATGAMVVFTNGEPALGLYRKFRIRTKNASDDTAMMREVLQRRLRHIEWQYPDLILVDGGKGQISATLAALKDSNVRIPVVGLAKKEETVIVQNNAGWHEIKLPEDSKALQLIQNMRDEAHRFAKNYHKKLRNETLI